MGVVGVGSLCKHGKVDKIKEQDLHFPAATAACLERKKMILKQNLEGCAHPSFLSFFLLFSPQLSFSFYSYAIFYIIFSSDPLPFHLNANQNVNHPY